MSPSRVVHCCAALLSMAGWSAATLAQSIDPSGASLALHRPFSLRLPVRAVDAETPSSARRLQACVDADFQSGSTVLFSDQMRVTLVEASARSGWQWLVFEHPHVVDDPTLLAHVVLRCPARFEREFIVHAVAGDAGSAGAAAPVAIPVRVPVATAAAVPLKVARRPVEGTKAAAFPVVPVSSRLVPATPAAREPTTASISNEAHALKAEVARLQEALASAQRQMPATASPLLAVGSTAVLQKADSPRLSTPGTTPLLLLLAGTLLSLLPLLRWWRQRVKLPLLQTMDVTRPPASAATVAVPAAPRAMPTIHVVVEGRPETPELIPPTPIPPGAASLEDHDAARFTSQIEGLVTDGYLGVAISLLEKSLEATPARNPWLMLQLLGLYERTGEAGKGAQLIGQLQLLYRVHLPTVGGLVRPGRALLEMPALLAQVQQAWTSADLVETLEDLVFREVGPVWDLATFQDLLMLHAVATARTTLAPEPAPPVPKPFEPVLEWTTVDDR